MSSVMVAVFCKNRFDHLRLTQTVLRESKNISGNELYYVAFDDHSTDPQVCTFLKKQFGNDVILTRPCPDVKTADQRIGCARHLAVETFLNFSKCDYLLLLDDDIIITKKTIAEAVSDYKTLVLSKVKVGGMTLYAFPNHIKYSIKFGESTFGAADLSGDAHMLFSRSALATIGNNFSSDPKGFADNQIKAILTAGMSYFTRISPPYQVQHIGFGDGASLIHEAKSNYFWIGRPYWRYDNTKTIVHVRGFDVEQYYNLTVEFGGVNAPKIYFEKFLGRI